MTTVRQLLPRLRLPVVFLSLLAILYCGAYLAFWTPNFQFESAWKPDGVLRVMAPFPGSSVEGLLQADDVIVAIDGKPVHRTPWRPLFPPGREAYDYTVLRQGQELQVRAPVGDMSFDLLRRRQSSIVVALGAWVVGALIVLFATPQNHEAWLVGLVTLGLAVVLAAAEAALYGAPMTWLASDPLLPFFAVSFVQLGFLPRKSPPGPVERRVMAVLYGVAVALGLLALAEILLLDPRGRSFEQITGVSLYDVLLLALGLGLVLNPIVLLVRFGRTPRSYQRQQVAVLLMGTFLAIAPLVWFTIVPNLLFGAPFVAWEVSILFVLLIPATYGYVILRRRYLQLDIFAAHSLFLAMMVICVFVAFALLSLFFAREPYNRWPAPLTNTLSFTTALASVALLGQPFRRTATSLVFGAKVNYEAERSRLNRLLSRSPQHETLGLVFRRVVELLDVRQAALFLTKGEDRVQLLTSVRANDLASLALSALESLPDRPLLRQETEATGLLGDLFQQHPWAEMFVPLSSHGQFVGAMLFGRPVPDAYFTAWDVQFVAQMAHAMAVAAEAGRLLESALEMSRSLLQVQARERTRLAVALHNEPLQRLTLVANELDNQVYGNKELDLGTHAVLAHCLEEIHLITGQIRELCIGLRPPILTQGVYWTVREVVSQFRRATELTVHLDMDRASLESLPVSVSPVVYQVLHESLMNVEKHAQASQVWIHVVRDANTLGLCVEDDGCGIPSERSSLADLILDRHFGMVGMHEWVALAGGELQVRPRDGGGTVVSARIPLPVPQCEV